MLYKLCRPLISDEFRVSPIASRNELFAPILKNFGSPNGVPNSIFQAFFSTLFFNAFEHPILMEFWGLWIRKITIFLTENNDFCEICIFDKNTQIARFCLRFQKPKRRKSIQNSNDRIQKRVVLKHRVWRVFPWILDAFWNPKNIKKSQIFEKNDVRRRPL